MMNSMKDQQPRDANMFRRVLLLFDPNFSNQMIQYSASVPKKIEKIAKARKKYLVVALSLKRLPK